MATQDPEPDTEPTLPQRIVARVTAPLAEPRHHTPLYLAVAAFAASLAAPPFGGIAAVSLVVVAWELGRRR